MNSFVFKISVEVLNENNTLTLPEPEDITGLESFICPLSLE